MTVKAFVWGMAVVAYGATAAGVETWRVHEFALKSAKDYSSGGGDAVMLDVEFSNAKTGEKLIRPGFWDGDATFRVRFAPPSPGAWVWKTTCENETSLNGKMGGFLVDPYSGDLAIYRHGFVRVEPGKKYFTYADGTPFFYLGDTHWGMYREEIDMPGPHAGKTGAKSHFKYVVKRRAEQGFTVYQSEPIGATFDVRDGKVDAADIPGFRLADRYYQAIAEAGLVHANAQFFFASEMGRDIASDWAALARLARYWVARFGAYPVMWTLGQEIDNDFYADRGKNCYNFSSNPWVRVANAIHANDCYGHPLSGHQENTAHTTVSGEGTSAPERTGNGRSVFYEERVAKKAGHNWWAAQWSPPLAAPVNWEVPRDYWASSRPAVNYEGRYCGLWTKDYGARAQGWISFLSGFCGYGYGAIDMWLYQSTYDIGKSSFDGVDCITVKDKMTPWCVSIEYPSALHMKTMRKFFEELPWWELTPDLGDGSLFSPTPGAVYSCAAKGNELYVLYFSGTNTLTGSLKGFDSTHAYTAQWFNPRKGDYRQKVTLPAAVGTELPLPRKPDARDWVLCVRKLSASAPRAIVSKDSAKARGLYDWNRAKALSKGVKLLMLDEEVDTPLDSGDVRMLQQAEGRLGRSFKGKRQMKSYVMRIDLKLPGIGFAATGRDKDWGKPMPPDPTGNAKDLTICTTRLSTGSFMAQMAGKHPDGRVVRPLVGFNTGTWGPWPEPQHFYANPSGLTISEGVMVKDVKEPPKATFVVWRDGTPDVLSAFPLGRTNEVWIAHTGRGMILENGEACGVLPGSNEARLLPRMALGLSKDRNYLYLLAIDARKPGWSMGGIAMDMVRIFRSAGAWDAIDFDGNNASLCDWDRHKGVGMPVNRSSSPRVALNIAIYQDLSRGRKGK